MDGIYDEALLRFRSTGPEFDGFLANHGPMAVDALVRMGHAGDVDDWVERYLTRLEDAPGRRWRIEDGEWREALGDVSRLGDWLAYLDRELALAPWTEVLATWWPRLLPGGIASATHALIRTGHAVRALREEPTQARVGELAQALGYWAARWAPLPPAEPHGELAAATALGEVPPVPDDTPGATGLRVAALFEDATRPAWTQVVGRAAPAGGPAEVERALDDLVDAAVTRYRDWAPSQPVMLVHMATAPRAARLVLGALPADLWPLTYSCAWRLSAAIGSMYRPHGERHPDAGAPVPRETGDAASAAADHGDEHAIKLTEVALESHRRGNPAALEAAGSSVKLIEAADRN